MEFQRFTKKNMLINALLVSLFLIWTVFVIGAREDHFFLVSLYLISFYAHEKSRKFIIGFSIFIVYWMIYDAMRIVPNYEVSKVHILEPYQLEKSLFGIMVNNVLLTPNEYFVANPKRFLDLLSGLFYINWVPIPLAFGVYLFVKDKLLFTKFSMVFLLVNLVGFVIYYIYPTAPPWYVQLYGFDLHIGVPGNRAGLARFDEMVGLPIFKNIYNKNANVLAAMPSLHASYPVVVLFYGIKRKIGWVNILFVIFMLGIWFSAVYSSHHYIIDIILGVFIALSVIGLFEKISGKPYINNRIQAFISKL